MSRWFATLGVCLLSAGSVRAQAPAFEVIPAPPAQRRTVLTNESLSPRERAAEIARLRYLLYRRVEYPSLINQIDSQIRYAEAELAALDRQIAEYESISRPHMSHPFQVTLESARMRRLNTELRLQNLRREKVRLVQNYQITRRLRQLEIEAGLP